MLLGIRKEVPFTERREVVPRTMTPVFCLEDGGFYFVRRISMKKKKSLNITLAIFIGLVLARIVS